MSDYNFETAQKHELDWQLDYIRDVLPEDYNKWVRKRMDDCPDTVLTGWFKCFGLEEFREHMVGKRAMEIGCGSIPHLRESWHNERIVVDPLAMEYKKKQDELFGGSFFEGMQIIDEPAENTLEDMIGYIDGVIICRNTLDHAEDPLMIIENIAMYTAPDCYLLFWSDLWHGEEPDAGHRNITKSVESIIAVLRGFGFRYVGDVGSQHDDDSHIEFGGIFQMS